MQTALVMTSAGPRVAGLTKLLVTPGGGKKAGSVISLEEFSVRVNEPMLCNYAKELGWSSRHIEV